MSICIGYPHGKRVNYCFVESLLRSINELPAGTLGALQSVSAGAYSLDRARNEIVERFLNKTDSEWLLQIDTDMQWKPQDILALAATADADERPVVGALAFRIQGTNPEFGSILVPTMFRFNDEGVPSPVVEYDGVERVDVTGAAFLLVHRSVFERIGERWFSHHPEQDTSSEDWAFCLRLRDAGIPVHVDSRIKIGHEKDHVYTEDDYNIMLHRIAAQEQKQAQQVPAPLPNRAARRAAAKAKR